jgi:hypothetical protein
MQNIGFGTCSLYSNTNGNNNIGVGHCSLFGNTTGQNNIAIGSFSLNKVTFGYNNIGIGYNAGGSLTQGIENIAIGTCALKSSNSQCNIALGVRALENGSIGGFSTVVGHDSFTKVNGYCNTAVGFKAGCLNEGSCNVVLGNFALNSPSAIGRSIAIGTWSMSDLGEGDENLAIGVCALKGDGVGSPAGCNQLAIGNYALECSTQNQQVAVGWCALHLGGVDGDIAIGHEAHRSVPNQATTTQTQASVYIGQCAGYDISETSQRSVSLGALVSTNQRENSANVAIGYCSNVGRSSQNTFNYNNTLVGACTAQLMSDVYNSVAIGADTGCLGDAFKSRTDVTGCFAETTAIGSRALNSGRCYIGVIAIGYQAGSVNGYQAIKEACENITIIGNINTLEHYIAGECRSSIDNRYKNILGDAPAGLPYINSLSTVTYQRCDPDTNQLLSTTCYYGVDSASAIAAEQTPGSPLLMETSGVSQDNHHISKDGLITMLVNSVQELSAQVTALQAQVDALSNP